MALRAPLVLRVHRREIESARVLRRVRMRLALVDLEVAHLAPGQRAVLLHHALDRAHDEARGECSLMPPIWPVCQWNRLSVSLRPVSRTLSALMTMTLSPQSTCGVNVAL